LVLVFFLLGVGSEAKNPAKPIFLDLSPLVFFFLIAGTGSPSCELRSATATRWLPGLFYPFSLLFSFSAVLPFRGVVGLEDAKMLLQVFGSFTPKLFIPSPGA